MGEKGLIFQLKYNYLDSKDWENQKVEFIKKCKKEEDLVGLEIRLILEDFVKGQGYLTKAERNAVAYNTHPFDLVAGKSDDNSIELIGFEIKGDSDNYSKLGFQLNNYVRFCDEVYIVLHKKKAPDWLPDNVGVLRVSEKGKILQEKTAMTWRNRFFPEISTNFEWNALKKTHGIQERSEAISTLLELAPMIWKRVLFNRFFGIVDGEKKVFVKYYPFSENELTLIAKINLDYQFEELEQKIVQFRKALQAVEGALLSSKVKNKHKVIEKGQQKVEIFGEGITQKTLNNT